MKTEITFDFDLDTTRIRRAFETKDDIGTVIRIHYELDRCLSHVLSKFFKNPRKLEARRVGPKLLRLEAIGLNGPRLDLANALDAIRNDFAHRDREELTDADIAQLDKIFRELNPSHSGLDSFNLFLNGEPVTIANLLHRQKFCLYGSASISTLASLPHEMRAHVP